MRSVPESTESPTGLLGHLYTSVAATVLLVVICCGVYPAVVWAIAQTVFPAQADGSLVDRAGRPTTDPDRAVGSRLLAQSFTAAKYFHPRPSAAGGGYDATSSGGTNLGPLSEKLLNGVHGSTTAGGTPNPSSDFDGVVDLAKAYRAENGLAADALVPADAVTRSASGLDPHISPANAEFQVARVAKARDVSEAEVRRLVAAATDRPTFGLLGDPGVNVLLLNLSLDHPMAK